MRLFVGLGNPEPRYALNRHNIGFMAVEAIAERHRFRPWRRDRDFHGRTAEGQIDGESVLLLEPETYMNESGRAVAAVSRYKKIGIGDLVVLHDEIELPPAKVRVKVGGGNAGHNGLRSITEHIGNDYRRVRIGVGHPGVPELVHRHVLSDFSKGEREWVEALCGVIADNAELIVRGEDSRFQNKVHLAMEAKGFASPKSGGRPQAEPDGQKSTD